MCAYYVKCIYLHIHKHIFPYRYLINIEQFIEKATFPEYTANAVVHV